MSRIIERGFYAQVPPDSQETGRGYEAFNISDYDLYDTYLPQFEIAFKEGGASGLMCSYAGENGHPSCANGELLNGVVRQKWGFQDTLITTDCGAVLNLRHAPAHAPSNEAAAAWALNNGTDLEMGSFLFLTSLANASAQGLTNASAIMTSVRRALKPLFRVGLFDDIPAWPALGQNDIASAAHVQIRDEAASQSFVLLKHTNNVLPLRSGVRIAVIGPQANSTGLFSDYFGDDVCWSAHPHYQSNTTCATTIAAAVGALNIGGVTTTRPGVGVSSKNTSMISEALEAGSLADIIILALGIDKSIEREGTDRTNITLPGLQESFALQVLDLGKPTIVVLTNGGPLAIESLVPRSSAIIEAFNPGFGAPMLARALFGKDNRWGKLP